MNLHNRKLIAWGVAAGAAWGEATVYVVNVGSNDVSVVDPVARAVTATIVAGTQPNGVAVTPDGRRAGQQAVADLAGQPGGEHGRRQPVP